MRLLGWRPVRQGKLYGFAEVELPIGLIIGEIPLLRGPEGLWAVLPSKPELDRDGRTVRTGGDGKALYREIMRWRSRMQVYIQHSIWRCRDVAGDYVSSGVERESG